jgi:hypothetical protein
LLEKISFEIKKYKRLAQNIKVGHRVHVNDIKNSDPVSKWKMQKILPNIFARNW